jgi:hypothetical protein
LIDHVGQHCGGGRVHRRVVAGEILISGRVTPAKIKIEDSLVRLSAIESQIPTPRIGLAVMLDGERIVHGSSVVLYAAAR